MNTASTPPAVHTVELQDEAATECLGRQLADALTAERCAIERQGFVLALSGDLGAGKTSLVRAILRALGVAGPVKSPTFALLEPYVVSSLNFYHFDFFRFADPGEFDAAGFRELFGPGAICAIEWPERAAGRLSAPDLAVLLAVKDEGRKAELRASTALGTACLNRLIAGEKPLAHRAGAS
jgi:tRNA threonylcarbamoyladenosine biosynthesis protein TsaE